MILPDDAALRKVVEGLFPRLSRGQTVLCLSTHSLEAKILARDAAAARGATLLEGELSGTPAMLRSGRAKLLIAGGAAAVEHVTPLLRAAVGAVTCLPKFGDATHVKPIINYLVALHTIAAAEALVLAQAMGVDPSCVVEAAADSAADSTMLAIRGRMMMTGDYSDGNVEAFFKFFTFLRNKLRGRMSEPPLLSHAESAYRRSVEAGFGDRDPAVVFEILKRELSPHPERKAHEPLRAMAAQNT